MPDESRLLGTARCAGEPRGPADAGRPAEPTRDASRVRSASGSRPDDRIRRSGGGRSAVSARPAAPARPAEPNRPSDRTDPVSAGLTALPLLYSRCEAALQPGRTGGAVREHPGRRGTGLPFREAAFDARSRILGVLASWAGLVAAERHVPAPRRNVPELVRFLAAHRDWLAGHPGGADFLDELSDLVSSATAALDDPRPAVPVGSCPVGGCRAPVHLRPATATVACEAGHDLPPADWLDVRTRDDRRRRTVPTKEAALAVGVPEATVRQWARRGKLTRYGSARRAEYCLDELTSLRAGQARSDAG
ncbi:MULTISPECIES: helix-turn-helix domain-containing protein [Amycolatopsis]|uniref:helix-turn-helix domain-containing protein n=1 Tax=Amycolatopsis TaxID=1813 RepID=UPI001F3DDAF4|nr:MULTISPECIES: helix-turn-helix domain-containing protein [Amycolatopsis]UKD56965.1 helix-turn-helix domain-containing protein [Amycolatopsis sp. FU40]